MRQVRRGCCVVRGENEERLLQADGERVTIEKTLRLTAAGPVYELAQKCCNLARRRVEF
jgi:hypothetical protein